MSVYERSETYVKYSTILNRDKQKVDPSTVKITIKDPCGVTLVDSQNMTKSSTGVYSYNAYDIRSDATYGEYDVTVKATSGAADVSIQDDKFFVMPWKLQKDVRRITGINDEKSINDDDLSHIAWHSYLEALRDSFVHHYKEIPLGNPDTGEGFNGTNTTFQTPYFPIADSNGDGTVSGYGQQSCGTDINCWWIDTNGSWQQGYVTVNKAENGEISITQTDGTAIPNSNEGVYLDYWIEHDSFNLDMFRDAVSYLAAHYVVELRMNEVDRVTIADLATNNPIVVKNERRFYNTYRRKLKKICKPRIGGA